jgi:hypothetical protein
MGTEDEAELLLDDLIGGPQRALIARAFVELGLPGHLMSGPASVDDLAEAAAADPASLARLLNAVEALGLCASLADGRYELTTAGALLAVDGGGATGWLMLMTQPWMTRAWEGLANAVRTGESSFGQVNGSGFWEYVAQHPEDVATFQGAMTSGATERAEDLAAVLDFDEISTVVDVGGGEGLLAAELVRRRPQLRAVVADRPEVVSRPDAAVVALGEQISMVPADFFEALPSGGDLYVLSRILHDWSDAAAAAVLRQCRAVMADAALLAVLEHVAPDEDIVGGSDQLDLAIKDLNMLVLVGGRERTLAAYRSLLESAGFDVVDIHNGSSCDVIVARPRVSLERSGRSTRR